METNWRRIPDRENSSAVIPVGAALIEAAFRADAVSLGGLEHAGRTIDLQQARRPYVVLAGGPTGSISDWWFHTCLECIAMVVSGAGCHDMRSAWVEPIRLTDAVWTVAYAPPINSGRTHQPQPARR